MMLQSSSQAKPSLHTFRMAKKQPIKASYIQPNGSFSDTPVPSDHESCGY